MCIFVYGIIIIKHDEIQNIIETFLDSSSINYDICHTSEDELMPDLIINHNSFIYY